MDVFLVVIIEIPTKKAVNDDGAAPVIIVQPTAVMARDEQQAAMKAMRFVPEEKAAAVDRLEVRVLPFGRPGGSPRLTDRERIWLAADWLALQREKQKEGK